MFKRYIQFLSSTNANKRKKAMNRLASFYQEELDLDEVEELIKASARMVYQDNNSREDDCCIALLEFVSQYDVSELCSVIKECFPDFSVWGRSYVFTMLTQTPTTETLNLMLELLRMYSGKTSIYDFTADDAVYEKEYISILFPELLTYTNVTSIAYSIYHILLGSLLREGVIKQKTVEEHLPTLLKRTELLIELAQSLLSQSDEMHQHHPDYMDTRHNLGLYLDLVGLFPRTDESIRILVKSMAVPDEKIHYFAAISLNRFEEPVPNDILERIASQGEMLCYLYEELKSSDQLSIFPSAYLTQEKFAESNMKQWLLQPHQLGKMPDELELMKIITDQDEDGEEVDFYVYRFRSSAPEWEHLGWMSAVSGYYRKNEMPTTTYNLYTFSLFTSWDEKTPEGHVEEILSILTSYYDDELDDE